MSKDSNNSFDSFNERPVSPNGPDGGAEFRALVRELNAVGASHRATLSEAALERIFAASDLQLPIPSAPIAGRIGPTFGRTFGVRFSTVFRIAAAAAVVVGLGAIAVILVRANSGVGPATVPGGALVEAQPAPTGFSEGSVGEAGVSLTPKPRAAQPTLAAEHLDSALSDDFSVRTTSRSASGVIVVLDTSRYSVGYTGGSSAATMFEGGRAEAFAPNFFDGSETTYEDLSSEFAALVSQSALRQ